MGSRPESGAGVVPVELERQGAEIVFGWMEQPIPRWRTFGRTEELLAALGVHGSLLPIEEYDLGPSHLFVELGSAAEVAALEPDFAALGRVTSAGANCFARAGSAWKSRAFFGEPGTPADPPTGPAASA